ncbi:MAG TPA: 6-phosphofructokinase [Bacteroidia bacterium]|jgi:6-phosphofructokinase 1|nr:6-phosphofructokinase [Bacteroidia bacterium]
MKNLALFTSGGDSPGMNACIRAVVRTAVAEGINVFGIRYGYDGLINDDFIPMDAGSVANIIHRGGTILKTARSAAFMTEEGMRKAKVNLEKRNIDGVVAIGGDGTFRGAVAFSKICDIPFIGCPGTIDNDLKGTDFTIGFDTAINTAIECVDKIRDTAESHDRVFIVEVMGRDAGLIALYSGIGAGAEGIMIPETKNDLEKIIERLKKSRESKRSKIIIVAEGDEEGGGFEVGKRIRAEFPNFDVRITILGHVQRGGSPSAMERMNASKMGYAAVEALLMGKKNEMIGIVHNKVAYTPFEEAVKHLEGPDVDLLRMIDILAR